MNHTPEMHEMPKTPTDHEVLQWARDTFGILAYDPLERMSRFFEEAVELAQTYHLDRDLLDRIIDRVYNREAGRTPDEIAQVHLCLKALAANHGAGSVNDLLANEFAKLQKKPKEYFQERHDRKAALGIAKVRPDK